MAEGRLTEWLRASPLRHRDFTLLWIGFFVSQIGSQMQVIAVAWQVYKLTHDPLALGAIGLARVVPVIALGVFGGVAADVVDRRKLLLVTQSAMMATSLGLFALTTADRVTVPILYAFCFVSGAAVAAGNPARQAMIPTLVPESLLARALGLSVTTWQLATVVGPTVGGIVLAARGPGLVYLIDGLSFLAMIAVLLAIRSRGAAAPEARADWRSVAEGFRFLARTPILLSLMLVDFLGTFFAGAMLLLPIFADQLLDVGPSGLGLLFAAPSVGSALVALTIAVKGPPPLAGATVLWSVGLYGLATAAFGATRSFPAALLFLVFAGAADGISTVVRQTLRQLLTPDELRGRMTGLSMIFFMGGPQLGELEAGVVGRLLGVRVSVVLGGLACATGAVVFAAFAHGLRRFHLHTGAARGA
jgi:MFS family permease